MTVFTLQKQNSALGRTVHHVIDVVAPHQPRALALRYISGACWGKLPRTTHQACLQ